MSYPVLYNHNAQVSVEGVCVKWLAACRDVRLVIGTIDGGTGAPPM